MAEEEEIQQPSQEDIPETPEAPEDRPSYDPEMIHENSQPVPPNSKDDSDS